MSVKQVSRDDYDIRQMPPAELFKELIWYAHEDDEVIGVVILDKTDKTFSCVVMAEELEQGPGFTGVDLKHSIASEEEAIEQLHKAIDGQVAIMRRNRVK